MNAFVLAGGASSRMGRDKALLELHGQPLIRHALAKLNTIGFMPRIVGSRPDLTSLATVVADNFPQSGPLGGIEAALAASDTDQNLVIAVDLPLLPASFLHWIADRAALTNALATIPFLQGRPQPLCATYNRALLPHVRAALTVGNFKIMHAIQSAAAHLHTSIDAFHVESVAAAQSWPQAVPLHRWFQNINTPADLESLVLEHFAGIE